MRDAFQRHSAECSEPSALDPLLLAIDRSLDAGGRARIFPHHFAERRAGGLLFLQRRQRLSEPQQGVRGFCRLVVFAGDVEEDFGGVAKLLALKQAFAQPILRIPQQRIAGIFLRETAHGLLGERVIPALHVTDTEVVFVARRVRRRRGGHRAGRVWTALRRWRQGAALRIGAAALRIGGAALRIARPSGVGEIERLTWSASTRRADRCVGCDRKLAAAKCLRCARRIRALAGIERIPTAPAFRSGRRSLRDRRASLTSPPLRVPITRLRLVAALDLTALDLAALDLTGLGSRLAVGGGRLHRRRSRDIRLRRAGAGLRATLQLAQALFELAVTVLQFLVLAGE